MADQVKISTKPTIDFDEAADEVADAGDGSETVIVSIRCKTGKKPYLVLMGQAWDAIMDTFLEWSLQVDKVPHSKFFWSKTQKGPPEEPAKYRLELPQNCLVEIISRSSVAGNVAGRLRIDYEDYQ